MITKITENKVEFIFETEDERETLGALLAVGAPRCRGSFLNNQFSRASRDILLESFDSDSRAFADGSKKPREGFEKENEARIWSRFESIIKKRTTLKE